jgi:hypothetical protein
MGVYRKGKRRKVMEEFLKIRGKINYFPRRPSGMSRGTDWWCVVEIDKEITRYYRWFVNKEIMNPLGFEYGDLSVPSFDAHITIVRGFNDVRGNISLAKKHWGKYNGEIIEIQFYPYPRYSGDTTGDRPNWYWFIDVESERITEIRKEMKLKTDWHYHLTIGRIYEDRMRKVYKK